MRNVVCFVLALLITVPASARAQTYDRVLVINLVTPNLPADNRVITLDPRSSLMAELESAATQTGGIEEASAKALLEGAEAEQVKPASRWIATTGARLAVFVFHDEGTVANVRFNEEARRTRLAADLLVLAELGLALAGPQDVAVDLVTKQEYTLRRPRANLTVATTVTPKTAPVARTRTDSARAGTGAAGGGATTANAAAAKPAEQPSASITVVTGPPEHVFLSANAGSADGGALKFNDESDALELRENPTGFFIGVNFSFGDILTDPADIEAGVLRRFWEGMYVGGAVQGSRRPFDQAGVHLGFRNNPLPLLRDMLNFETVSPYVGLVWTKNDQVDAEGNRVGERRFGRREFIWGVSLNLDKALGWVGGGGN